MTSLTVQDGKLVVRNGALGTTQGCCCNKCSGPCPNGATECAPGCGCSNSQCVPCSGPCDEENPCPEGCECVDGQCVKCSCDSENKCPPGCGECCNGECTPCPYWLSQGTGTLIGKSPCAKALCDTLGGDKDTLMQQLNDFAGTVEDWWEANGYTVVDKVVSDNPVSFQMHCDYTGFVPDGDGGGYWPCELYGDDPVPTFWGANWGLYLQATCCCGKVAIDDLEQLTPYPQIPLPLGYYLMFALGSVTGPCVQNPFP